DRENDEVIVARVPEAARRGRLDVAGSARAELELLSIHLEAGDPPVDEVELILLFVKVFEPLGARREHECVRAEGRDAELAPERPEDPVAHARARRVSVTYGRCP